MAETKDDPHGRWKIGGYIPNWLKREIKREMADRDVTQEELLYESLSARYPSAKKRYERNAAV
jgi:hypothetical protein